MLNLINQQETARRWTFPNETGT